MIPPPSRHSGDAQNDARACAPGYAWAAWDFPSGRSLSFSFAPTGEISGAGWTRGGAPDPWGRVPWRAALRVDQITDLFAWALAGDPDLIRPDALCRSRVDPGT